VRASKGAEHQHLAEHRGGLGEGQESVGHQIALIGGQHLMHAMTELVRQDHHVAHPPVIIERSQNSNVSVRSQRPFSW
jgi:hypothetical protein